MQWAIRNRDPNRGVRLSNGSSNLVFIESAALRRSAPTNVSQDFHPSGTPASSLARAFGSIIRQISELLNTPPDQISSQHVLHLKHNDVADLQKRVEMILKPTWDWILNVMDATEAQLKFGASLTNSADRSHPLHPLHSTTGSTSVGVSGGLSETQPSRREFLTYCLSLMRAHSSEHRDSLPVLDVTSLRHIAYVLDAIIFYMRSVSDNDVDKTDSSVWNDQDDNEDNDEDLSGIGSENEIIDEAATNTTLGRRHGFFQRSESTLCLGCPAPDAFNTPMIEALPLADQPHLLQPNAKREDLFMMTKPQIVLNKTNDSMSNPLAYPPTHLGLSSTLIPNAGSSKLDGVIKRRKDNTPNSTAEESTPSIAATSEETTKTAEQIASSAQGPSNETGTDFQAEQPSKQSYIKPYGHIKKRVFYDQYSEGCSKTFEGNK